jgi:hypothetical protein
MSAGCQLDLSTLTGSMQLTSQTSFFDLGRPIVGLTEPDNSLEIYQSDMLDYNLPFPLFVL